MRTTERYVATLATAILIIALVAPVPVGAAASVPASNRAAWIGAPGLVDTGVWLDRLGTWLATLVPTPADEESLSNVVGRAGSSMDPNGTPSSGGTTESGLDGGGSWEFVAPAGGGMDPNG